MHESNLKPGNHDAYAALRVRNYQLFMAGWLPASIGLQMQSTALAWEVYEKTSDALALGLVGVARALPTIALALPAGQIVDLLDRRRVLIATQIGFALASGLLVLGSISWQRDWLGDSSLALWIMYALIALTGCARLFNGPSRSSLLPEILPGGASGPTFVNAITWNSFVFHLAAMVGPLLAGVLIAIMQAAWPVYLACGAGCAVFAITAQHIRPFESHLTAQGSIWGAIQPRNLLPGILEGVTHMWRERVVLGAITLDLAAVLLGGATALMPIFARDILHVGPVGLGALRAAPYAGALLMALLLAHLPPFRRAGRALLLSVAGFGACTIVFGFSENLWLSLAMLAALGALDNISVVIRHVLVSVRTPDRLRGRVNAVNMVFIESSNELGGFESGLVAKFFGPVFSAVSGGVGTLLVVMAIAIGMKDLRRLGRLDRG